MARRRCKGKTKAGKRCTRRGVEWCAQHVGQRPPTDTERTLKKAPARKPADWRPRFLAAFEEHVTVSRACQTAGVSRSNVYAERERSESFAAAWGEVEERTTEEMEREAYRRAVEGWVEREEYTYVDGEQFVTERVRKWSDTLLIFMLKARRPDTYRENHKVEHSGPAGGPIAAEIVHSDAREHADATREFLRRLAGPDG